MGRTTARRTWVTPALVGIVLATFFSDFSHEMATAALPLYLASLGLGPAALGTIEGVADFLISLSKLGGGVLGHHARRKRPWASLGYVVTAAATSALALAHGVASLVTLRGIAWIGRGFRSPLRDHMLADAVGREHYGRAYGLERAGDMLGAVAGPLATAALLALAVELRHLLLWTLVPGALAAASMFFLTRGVERERGPAEHGARGGARPRFPCVFWLFLAGVLVFGLGDFSRTFLVWLAARGLGQGDAQARGSVTLAVLLYAGHNLVAAVSAYPIGWLGDRRAKAPLLIGGYGLGVLTNLLLAGFSTSVGALVAVIALSGITLSAEETLEKAVAAELLPRELRSLGFGVLACGNAVGDMLSSLYVGALLQRDRPALAFGIAAACGALGVAWMLLFFARRRRSSG